MAYTTPQLNVLLDLVRQLKPCPIGMGIVDVEYLLRAVIDARNAIIDAEVAEARISNSLDLATRERDNYEEELQECKAELAECQDKLEQCERDIDQLENDKVNLITEITELREALEEAQCEIKYSRKDDS